jgi:hypothetical protein
MSDVCVHGTDVRPVPPPAAGCEICLATGGTWVHLRQCLTCGVTLCCDSSPNRHMSTAHWPATRHPLMRSAEAEPVAWTWCFVDEEMVRETPDGWRTYDPYVVMGTWFAGRHLAAGGTVDPDEQLRTEEGFALGGWFADVRAAHAAGELDPIDVAAIEALPGWRW